MSKHDWLALTVLYEHLVGQMNQSLMEGADPDWCWTEL